MRQPLVLLAFAMLLSACEPPGKPKASDRWQAPAANMDFASVYAGNCRACHGDTTGWAASINLTDPRYALFVDPEALRWVTAGGVDGTTMPGFAISEGGTLTDDQVILVADGIIATKGEKVRPPEMPPYAAPLGDPSTGAAVFAAWCVSCHGDEGKGIAGKSGSIVDGAYLSLVSDQYLRTVTVVGRPELDHPGYDQIVPGKTMTAQEIADVVAWLASQRPVVVQSQAPPENDPVP